MKQIYVDENTLSYHGVYLHMYCSLKKLREQNIEKCIVQVCAPISSGGKGSIHANLEFLRVAIKTVNAQKCLLFDEPHGAENPQWTKGVVVFDQNPYEKAIAQIKANRKNAGLWQEYDYAILEECYGPLFFNDLFDLLIFLPGYTSSIGACWEMETAERLGIPCKLWNQILFSL